MLIMALGMRRPNRPLIGRAGEGNSGNQPKMLHLSVFQTAHFIDMQCRAVLEHGQDDAESDGGFRRGDNHHKERDRYDRPLA